MKFSHKITGLCVLFAVFAAAIFVGLTNVQAADALNLGEKMEDFKLPDADAKQFAFNDLKGKNGTVIVFLSIQCPVVNKDYAARLAALGKEMAGKGVNVVGINSNATETAEQVKANAETRGYGFTVLIDKGNVIADRLAATKTPEVYYFDKDNKLVYRGAIDNDKKGDNVTENYLSNAVADVTAGKPVAKAETVGFGCGIKRAEKAKQ